MTEYSHDDRDAAFLALREVLNSLIARGRKTLIQGVKPALQLHMHGRFNEAALGFRSFREFVLAAEAAGLVTTRRTEAGLSIEPPSGPRPLRERRVRPDLWDAFTDWSDDTAHAWDPSRRAVFRVQKGHGEEPTFPTGWVPIGPATKAEHRAWAEEFLLRHSASPTASGLRAALADPDDGFGQFSRLVHADPRLVGEWKGERRRRIARTIQAWADQNELDVSPFETVTTAPEPHERSWRNAQDRSDEEAVQHLRAVVKRAIDRMSITELRALHLPVGALEGTQL